MVSELRAALDNVPQAKAKRKSKASKGEEISATTSEKEFEAFLRSIKRCRSLLEAKRLRNDVELSIRRAKLDNEREALDVKTTQSISSKTYLQRLYTAREYIDKRIVRLGGADGQVSEPSAPL